MVPFTVILAGILALPALLLLVAAAVPIALLSIPALALLLYRKPKNALTKKVDKKTKESSCVHVIVTGGSSGIGLSIAKLCAADAAAAAAMGGKTAAKSTKITLVARNKQRLETAKRSVLNICHGGEASKENDSTTKNNGMIQVDTVSVDLSDAAALKTALREKIYNNGSTSDNDDVTTYLFCCAGGAEPAYCHKMDATAFQKAINVNQLSAVLTAQAFLPYITRGTIQFCSSMAGQVGIFGYASYSATKFALRGYAQVLHMELSQRPIHVQVAYPPDTDTPGFAEENKSKPEETHLIGEQAGLSQPGDIARIMVSSATKKKNPPFDVYFNFDGWMLSNLTAGFSPVSTLGDAVAQIALMQTFRLVSLFYLQDWWSIIRQCEQKRQNENEDKKNR